jgi:hypothetical protein
MVMMMMLVMVREVQGAEGMACSVVASAVVVSVRVEMQGVVVVVGVVYRQSVWRPPQQASQRQMSASHRPYRR